MHCLYPCDFWVARIPSVPSGHYAWVHSVCIQGRDSQPCTRFRITWGAFEKYQYLAPDIRGIYIKPLASGADMDFFFFTTQIILKCILTGEPLTCR